MKYEEFAAAVEDAKHTLSVADRFVCKMADMIAGRLRKASVSGHTLERLKRELRDYNIHTNSWRRSR